MGATVLMTVDESSYVNNGTSTGSYPSMGDPHPIAWYIESPESALPLADGAPKAGRSFYTSLGHLNSSEQRGTQDKNKTNADITQRGRTAHSSSTSLAA